MRKRAFFDLLIYKTRANVRTEVSRLYLNYMWWILEPLLSMGIFYVVFGVFMHTKTPHFALFLLIGLCQWQWFSATVLHACTSIYQNSHIMNAVDIPKIFFPLEIFLQDFFKYFFVVTLLAVFLLFYPLPITKEWFGLMAVFFVQGIFVLTVSIFVAAIVPFLPDLKFVIPACINILFFVSGIFFDVDSLILPQHRPIMYLNPMAGLIREYRNIIIGGQWPDWMYLFYVTLGTLLFLWFALRILKKYNRVYPSICR